MKTHGYEPDRYSYISVRELRGDRSAYLVTDGNHRLSALSALGKTSVLVKLPFGTTVDRSKADRWPLVKAGMVQLEDAIRIFDAYLEGNPVPPKATLPALIV